MILPEDGEKKGNHEIVAAGINVLARYPFPSLIH